MKFPRDHARKAISKFALKFRDKKHWIKYIRTYLAGGLILAVTMLAIIKYYPQL